MNYKIGFIGCGNMAQAIIGGMLQSNIVESSQIMASARSEVTIKSVNERFSIQVLSDNREVSRQADILFLAVKPDQYAEVIEEIRQHMKESAIVISMAPGMTLSTLEDNFIRKVKLVRTMPNTPSFVREGMTAFCSNAFLTENDENLVRTLLETFGRAEKVEESLMDAIPAVSGSSPAYVFMMIEALADGAVKQGISRQQAYKLAAQAVLGAAKMVLETGKHPAQLKDEVCSPGGATIEAVATLEQRQFKGTIIAAMDACGQKAKSMGEK
ncbi:pyrroline-5-carboxylate reductase [Bacillus kexueae]|uniref:pyrroline-5-carboxylate reductase n=1 Tax=Aeribacillus kexueae TaxID=2078952 RepID=UPI001FB003D0|nr:pyrroline-5-carboxylate reductase [Bacillus kexueae]